MTHDTNDPVLLKIYNISSQVPTTSHKSLHNKHLSTFRKAHPSSQLHSRRKKELIPTNRRERIETKATSEKEISLLLQPKKKTVYFLKMYFSKMLLLSLLKTYQRSWQENLFSFLKSPFPC